MTAPLRPALLLLAALLLSGCETARRLIDGPPRPVAGQVGFVRGFLGGVAADEPAAALAARNMLSAGGTAADAAAAAAFTLAVTLPSRAGLGGGGACLVYQPRLAQPEAVLFLPGPRDPAGLAGADRPAALPLMARGLFLLTTRLPNARPFEEVLGPAEQLARFGAPMSRALAADIEAVRTPLFRDPQIRAVLTRPDGSPVPVGERFTNPALAGSLAALRTAGVADLHQGTLARRFIEGVALAGGGSISAQELRQALPSLGNAIAIEVRGGDRAAFLPLEGGLAAAAGLRALAAGQGVEGAWQRALSVAFAARLGAGVTPALLDQPGLPPAAFPPLPASTALTVFDRNGGAVACAFTLNNLFGTGRIAPGTGILLAAAPGVGAVQPPLLSAAIVWNPNLRAFRMAAAGSGQAAAPMAVAGPIHAHLWRGLTVEDAVDEASPPEARAQIGACPEYLPRNPAGCAAAADPRGLGVALGAAE
ncbi:MAG: gamma-glutamyltransferase [Rhodovarius sp.]|nr:gamma-glutamyltransferase family protein [Rhodovarius sp.]MDW8314332.1 gamma-glutamyltransferase [Rhodovarius sp.]